jgi:hypothetical protein
LTVLLTRERSSGADHVKLANCVKDIETAKSTLVTQQTTLAAHTVLHEHSGERIDKLETRLHDVEDKQAQAFGREQGRRRQT